ncbi:MAG: hypothetical protein SGJ13_12215 [Actinomycetota bacterium]|nr:hypothetical protein [Actinomycetota bacterium]
MDLLAFGQSLGALRIADIRSIAAHDAASRDSIAGEVEVRRATLHVERVLRATQRRNQAAMAGLTVVALVQGAARRAGVELPDRDVTRVARAAELVARALVGGPASERDARLLATAFDRVSLRSA